MAVLCNDILTEGMPHWRLGRERALSGFHVTSSKLENKELSIPLRF